jgi:hypothetical protein
MSWLPSLGNNDRAEREIAKPGMGGPSRARGISAALHSLLIGSDFIGRVADGTKVAGAGPRGV